MVKHRSACAACRQQRKKCDPHCVLAPYFPADKTHDYLAVHRVFGFSNMTKMLNKLDPQARKEAVKSFQWEALTWKRDPVLGPLGQFRKLQHECEILRNQLMAMNQQHLPVAAVPNDKGVTFTAALPLTNNWALAQLSNDIIGVSSDLANVGNSLASSSSHSYVYSFSDEPEMPQVLNYVLPASPINVLHPVPAEALSQRSLPLPLQPSYLPMQQKNDQPSQIGNFAYHDGNRVINRDVGIQSGVQGTEGNVEGVYSNVYNNGLGQGREIRQGEAQEQVGHSHGDAILDDSGVFMAVNGDHAMAQNRVWGQMTDFQQQQQFFSVPLAQRQGTNQQQGHHGFQQLTHAHQSQDHTLQRHAE